MDTYILVKVYSNNESSAKKALSKVEEIYKNYHELVDRYNEYDNLNNVYYINNNNSNEESIEVDEKLYNLIKYSLSWQEKSNYLFDINMGNVIDVWKTYMEKNDGIPSLNELDFANEKKIDVVLLDNNKILNNHPNLDLGGIAKGYATEEVGEYLESIGLNQYLINAGGNVKLGKHYDGKKYKIGIENPNDTSKIYQKIDGENISIVTSGSYQRYYEYDGKRYHHIISPKTLYPDNYVKSVTVVAPDSKLADILSTTLFMMDVEDGLDYIKDFKDVEAIWYVDDNNIIKTEGFSRYE